MKVLHCYKTNTEAAAEQGVSREAVRKWVRDGVPAERVIPFCEKANWRTTPHALRPDLYPNPTDALPTHLVEKAA
jgi:hypothetical protein